MGDQNSKPVQKILKKVTNKGKSDLEIKFLGHAGFRLAFNDGEKERVIYIDTWL